MLLIDRLACVDWSGSVNWFSKVPVCFIGKRTKLEVAFLILEGCLELTVLDFMEETLGVR